MNRLKILIIGCSGSGKSTFARALNQQLEIPILHLDRIWHAMDHNENSKLEFKKMQQDFMAENENFIIDGNYRGTMDIRIPHANVIIWFRVPRRTSLFRVIKRSVKRKLKLEIRDDMANGFKEKFDRKYLDFLKFIWHFEKKNVPEITELLETRHAFCRLMVVTNKLEKVKLLNEITK